MTLHCNYVCGYCNVTLTSAKANSKHVKSGDPASTWWSSQLCGQFQFLGGKSHTEAKIKHSDCEQLDSGTHNCCSVLPSTYPTFPFLHWIPTPQAWWHYLSSRSAKETILMNWGLITWVAKDGTSAKWPLLKNVVNNFLSNCSKSTQMPKFFSSCMTRKKEKNRPKNCLLFVSWHLKTHYREWIKYESTTLKPYIQTLDLSTAIGILRRYSPDVATSTSSSVRILKLLFDINWATTVKMKNLQLWGTCKTPSCSVWGAIRFTTSFEHTA